MGASDDFQKGFNSGNSDVGGYLPSNANQNAGYIAGQSQRVQDDRYRKQSQAEFQNYEPLFSYKTKLLLIVIGIGGWMLVASGYSFAAIGLSGLSLVLALATISRRKLFRRTTAPLAGMFAGLSLGSFRIAAAEGVLSVENLWFMTALGFAFGFIISFLQKRRSK